MTPRDYERALKALAKADATLGAALDRLQAARDRGTAADCVAARLRAREAYQAAESALHEVYRVHREIWRARAAELRIEAVQAMAALKRYRFALRATEDPGADAQAIAAALDSLKGSDTEQPPADLGPIPHRPPDPPKSLDRGDESNL